MSKENVKKFYEELKADKALAEELNNAVKAVVLKFADKQGVTFTAEELAEFEKESRKLSDEELDQVSAARSFYARDAFLKDIDISRLA